jgi:hypothetical protein
MRRIVAVAVLLAFAAPLLPSTALAAGGRPLAPPSLNAVGVNVTHGGILPPLPGQTAFGSPGGYPLPLPGSPEVRLAPRRIARVPRGPLRGVNRFPATTVFYTPTALYDPGALYQPPPAEPPPITVNVSPVVYVSPTVYVAPTAAAPPPAPVSAPVPPSIVEYPSGRYELRGDGVATPYSWVWIPNPPAAPPVAASLRDEPRAPAAAVTAARSPVYRFTDDEGTVIWTNQVERVPEPLRTQAQRGLPDATPQ